MKIIFVIKSLHTAGGMERMTVTVANELVRRHHQAGIISLSGNGNSYFKTDPQVELFNLKIKSWKKTFPLKDIERIKQLKAIYKSYQPDVIIFVGSGRSMLNFAAAKGYRTITWEHFNANVNWHLLHPQSKKMAAKYGNRIVTLTQKDVANYQRKFGAKNAVCIPNPVTINTDRKSTLKHKQVLAVGRLMPQKGFDMLLDAWSKTKMKDEGWKLKIIGKGKLEPELRKKIKDLNLTSVELSGPGNIIDHYLESSIFAMSSRFEGLPLVLIEAMSLGLPIVSFDCETGPSEIIVHQENGFLVPTFNTDKFAENLDQLMQDEELRHKMCKNALERSKLFSVDNIIDQWEEVLQQVVNDPMS